MSMQISQHLRLSQQLVMTTQLQQAIKLLQLSRMELVDMVHEEMLENPLLEDGMESAQEQSKEADPEANEERQLSGETETPTPQTETRDTEKEVTADAQANNEIDWENYLDDYASAPAMPSGGRADSEEMPSLEATLTRRTSLFEHLEWQLKLCNLDEDEARVGHLILGNIDVDGYLKEPPLCDLAEEAEVSLEIAERVLQRIQQFDPVGVAARTLSECLLVQARHIGADDPVLEQMLTSHIGNLEKKNYGAIARDLKQPIEEIIEATKVIQELDPRPGRLYTTDEPQYVTPDVFIHKIGDKYFVVPNDDGLPKLKISASYRSMAHKSTQARDYVQEKLRSAQWLIRSIQQRQRTVVKVTEAIIKFQRDFFDKGIAHLKPLILRDIADDVGMHESTISRVTTNKYVHTPQGIFELKFFFNSGISRTDGDEVASQAVKNKIKELIAGEDQRHPHSDQKLVELLRTQTIDIARRTVAKYREQLGILSSSKRKQLF